MKKETTAPSSGMSPFSDEGGVSFFPLLFFAEFLGKVLDENGSLQTPPPSLVTWSLK